MFLTPCAIGTCLVLVFVLLLKDRRLDRASARRWSLRDLVDAFRLDPRRHPDFAWAFVGRFLFI